MEGGTVKKEEEEEATADFEPLVELTQFFAQKHSKVAQRACAKIRFGK